MGNTWTLQELIDAGMAITASCLDCRRSREIDLPALRDRLGPDASVMEWDLRPKMKCALCGGKRVVLTYTPDTTPTDHRKCK